MQKVLIYAGVWVLTILLIASITITIKDNVISSINYFPYHAYNNYCSCRNKEQLLYVHCHTISDLPNVASFETNRIAKGIADVPENTRTVSQNDFKNTLTQNSSTNYSIINTYNNKRTVFIIYNDISTKFPRAFDPEVPVYYLWKRRTLCTASDDEHYPIDTLANNLASGNAKDKNYMEKTKTLLDYNDQYFINVAEDPDSFKPHVRVKRTDSNPDFPFSYQQNYLKDLANSFPRNSYESIDENYDTDDITFDAKRETNSQEYYANKNRLGEPSNQITEKDVITDLSSLKNDKFSQNAQKNSESLNQTRNQESPNKDVDTVIQRFHNLNSETDPDLIRIKRNDYRKAQDKRSSNKDLTKISEENLSGSNDETEKIFENQKIYSHPDNLKESNVNDKSSRKPSSLAVADLKADLLRFKRRAKNDHHEKSSKSKKRKKHAGKKNNNLKSGPARSQKNVRSKNTNRPRSVSERKNSKTKVDGKSRAEFSKLTSTINNKNNMRRRSVSSIKSDDKEFENDHESHDILSAHAGLESIVEHYADTAGSKISLAAHAKSFEDREGSNENLNTLTMANENSSPTRGETKVRSKRDKNTASRHGFLSKEDELRYYQNIREFEPNKECAAQDDSTNYEVDNNRAARSIEEVRDLAKKLMTKVDELENYLSFDEGVAERIEGEEKKIETRGIDDLCSNVTSTCADFKETSEVVRRCVPTSTAKSIVNRNVVKMKEHKREKGKNGNLAVKKRSSKEHVTRIIPGASKNVRRESEKSPRKWGKWTDWSSCSVTCGKGRQIRWRYCLHDCNTAETEMEEKACQLPACPPGKFLGIF